MKIGDIVFFRKNESFVSRIISFVTGSSFSHVGIIYDIENKGVVIAEALAIGFNLNYYNTEDFLLKMATGKRLLKTGNLNPKKVKDAIDRKIGRPYGFVDLFRILVYKLTGKTIGEDCSRKLICSEAVARVIYSANKRKDLSKEYNKPFDFITPDDIFMSKYFWMTEPKVTINL